MKRPLKIALLILLFITISMEADFTMYSEPK